MSKPISGAIFQTCTDGYYYTRKRPDNAVSIIVVKTRRSRTAVDIYCIKISLHYSTADRKLVAPKGKA